jgi:hypothetical protein
MDGVAHMAKLTNCAAKCELKNFRPTSALAMLIF